MTDPLSLIPFSLAAGGGIIDGEDVGRFVAAGYTLLQRAAPLVRALAGRRGAILLPTSPAYFTALAACDGRGAVLVNPLAAPPEMTAQLSEANVGAVFTTNALATRLEREVREQLTMVLLDDAPQRARVVTGSRELDVDLGSHFALDLEGERDTPGSQEEAVIVYTSGMAGHTRGAILTHRNLLANARATQLAAQLTPLDHALALLPYSHLFGLVVSGIAPLLIGARVTTMSRFNPVQALDTIVNEQVTMLVAVPAVFRGLLAAIERRGGLPRHALRVCICGGAPLDVALQDRWAEVTRVELRQGYGLTEAGPVCLFNNVDAPNRRGTLGTAFPGVQVTIRDPDTRAQLPNGQRGEICVQGPNVFRGYLGNADDALHIAGGWLHTGDLGIADNDGVVTFAGVRKAMFTRNGFNIYPAEIERVLSGMPHVERVTVEAVPEPTRENDIRVIVHGDVTAAEVREFCERNLSSYKQPAEIEIVVSSRDTV